MAFRAIRQSRAVRTQEAEHTQQMKIETKASIITGPMNLASTLSFNIEPASVDWPVWT
jgi:hypothetical protein